jgi:tol-pal system protein YbgF
LLGGCASGPAILTPLAPELEQNMVELRALNARHLREINQLQNRVFVLETEIENQNKTDEPRRRRVWSVKLSSSPASASTPSTPTGAADPMARYDAPVMAPSSLAAEDATVEYAGEAALPARRNRVRPLLRLSGTGRPVVTYADVPTPETPAPVTVDPRKPLALYRRSLAALRAGHVAVALVGLRKFLVHYPHHSYADNVQYAIGESYFSLDQYQSAVRELKRVVERYPHGNKVPDAMLKIGLAHLARGEGPEARQALESLCRIYPRHAVTRLAKEKLATEHFARAEAHAPATASLDADRISSSNSR